MNKEEIESFKELNTDLEDIDDLDMGLEIISYKVRTTMQEFANTIINLQSQLDIANKKIDKIEKYIKENACYDENIKTCQCSFSSLALDNILSIIGGE